MKKYTLLLLPCALALTFSGPALAHTGLEFFLQEVPDPDAMTMDGDDSDWGWFDNDLALDSNLDFYVTSGEVADPEDYSATWRIAYSRPPDNRLYFFLRIQDDSLRRQEPDLKRMWHDDFTQFNLDNDHSGGPGLGSNLDEASNHQRYHLRILPGPDGVTAFNSQIEVLGDENLSWTQDVDLFGNATDVWDLAWTVTPPDAQHGTLDIEVTWEARFKTYDAVGLSEAESVRHVYEDGQVTHLGPRLTDNDGSLFQYDFYLQDRFTGTQNPAQYGTEGDQFPDWFLIGCEDCPNAGGSGATAVESSSWGRIKNHLSNQSR
ncbi:MAG: hypothetical protein OXH81_13430 [Gemmatimonadetes bacterium]|nr:hypothetical protein [Gemmatimonadota bacterium]MDE2736818.1 hypothetical protein [Gemmatimonadota bacterium]